MPTFDGSEGRAIPTIDAAAYTRKFRTDFPDNKKAYFVGMDRINELLAQPGAMGIRIYLGENILDDTLLHIMPVLVAADSSMNDIIGIVVDETFPCPPMCDGGLSPLLK